MKENKTKFRHHRFVQIENFLIEGFMWRWDAWMITYGRHIDANKISSEISTFHGLNIYEKYNEKAAFGSKFIISSSLIAVQF